MKINFSKYQGTGNDFIIVDNRDVKWTPTVQAVQLICNRHFGIGSDGLILIESSSIADFEMNFFNPDASKSFCGNGSRCAVAYCYEKGIINSSCTYSAIDGIHSAEVRDDSTVAVSIKDVNSCERIDNDFYIHTGSPHYISYTTNLEKKDIVADAKVIRYNDRFREAGTNVNYVEEFDSGISVRTYERGVENETLSCGSGVTACALSFAIKNNLNTPIAITTKGGNLTVDYKRKDNYFFDIKLIGPAKFVFEGEITIDL